MNVFPESMNRIDYDDPRTALSQIDNYIRYIVERVQFSTNGLLKSVQAGMTTAEVIQQLTDLQTQVSSAISTVASYSARINALENNTAGLPALEQEVETQRGEISEIIDAVDLLESDVEDLQDAIGTAQEDITTIQGAVGALEDALPLSGSAAPTTATPGTVGQLYIDTVAEKLYIMISESGGDYTWKEISFVEEPEPEPEP